LAYDYLDLYIQPVSQVGSPYTIYPTIETQDSENINSSLGTPPDNLVGVTESRDVSGCNGTLGDSGTTASCYQNTYWYDGRQWTVNTASYPVNQWVHVECYFQMNTITSGVANADGIMREYVNGTKILDKSDVVYRTGANPSMNWEEFVLGPYMGAASPVAQTMYMDELTVGDTDPYNTSQP